MAGFSRRGSAGTVPGDPVVERGAGRRVERTPERQAFVERHAERVDVDAPVDPAVGRLDLLRREIRRSPEELSGAGERDRGRRLLARDPEVEDHGPAVPPDHDVPGLDVAVHDSRFVRDVKSARRARDELDDAPDSRGFRLVSPATEALRAWRPIRATRR